MSTHDIPKFIINWTHYNTFLRKQDMLLADLFTHQQGKITNHEYERVLFGLLHHYALNFRTILCGWDDFLKNSKFKFSIYTLLRPLLADFLLMSYLLENFKFLVPNDAKHESDKWQVNADDFLKRYGQVSAAFFNRLDSFLQRK